MRYFTPLLFLAAGGFVGWYNNANAESVVLLPFLENIFPSLEGDLPAQGRVTMLIFMALGLVLLLWNGFQHMRQLRDGRAD